MGYKSNVMQSEKEHSKNKKKGKSSDHFAYRIWRLNVDNIKIESVMKMDGKSVRH